MDIDALIDDAADTGTKKKKSNVPTQQVTDPALAKRIEKYIKLNNDKSSIDAQLRDLKDEIVEPAREFHATQLDGVAKVPTTVKLMLEDGTGVDVDVAKNQYSKIPTTSEGELKDRFGDDYASYFDSDTKIELTKEAMADKATFIEVVKAVGEENFKKFFKVTKNLKPTERFHADRFLNEDAKPIIQGAIDEELVKPFSPAIRA